MTIMRITANITRRDLFIAGLCLLPRSRANWYGVAVIAAGVFAFVVHRDGTSAAAVGAALAIAVGSGIGAVLGGFLGSFAQLMLTSGGKSGIRGLHEFSLSPEGLHESTTVNDSHFTWSGIKTVLKLRQCIVVHIASGAAYIIPRKSFSSRAQYDAFFDQAVSYLEAGHCANLGLDSKATGG